MDALKLTLAFSPWIAFWVISMGHSILSLQIGILAAALLVGVMGVTRLHRGAILWAGVVFFVFALVSVAWLKNEWVIRHVGILASGTLFVATALSIVFGRPFTEDYARDHVPKELWDSPAFIRGSYTVTSVWELIFLGNFFINIVKICCSQSDGMWYQALEFGLIIFGILFTTLYARHARDNRAISLRAPDADG